MTTREGEHGVGQLWARLSYIPDVSANLWSQSDDTRQTQALKKKSCVGQLMVSIGHDLGSFSRRDEALLRARAIREAPAKDRIAYSQDAG